LCTAGCVPREFIKEIKTRSGIGLAVAAGAVQTRYDPPAPDAYPSGEAALSETTRLDALGQPLDFGLSERARAVLWLALLVAAAIAVQVFAGAYRAETGNYSDESAHFMNALLLRDYVTQAFGHRPFAFAEQYYLSYPKIAPLMWPPFFHSCSDSSCCLAGRRTRPPSSSSPRLGP